MISKNEQSPQYPLLQPHIFLQNKDVESFNSQIFELSKEEKYTNEAQDYIIGDVDEEIKLKVRKSIPTDTSKTMGLQKNLKLCKGMRCEISVNIDVEDGLSNGASGVLMGVKKFSKNNLGFEIIWIKFDNENIGKNCRNNGKNFYISKINTAWTPILKVKRAFMVGRYKSVQVVREQFPIRAAAAKTCHRGQGDTMDSAVVDFNGRCFPHCHYVSLSRVKKIETLFIRDLNEKKIHIDATVVEEMQRLQKNMKLIPSFKVLSEPSNYFTIYYQNVRSFNKHYKDVLQDIHIYHPDIMIFVESKLCLKDQDQDFTINGYIMQRFDIINTDGSRSPYGIVVYMKENLLPEIQLQCKHIDLKKGGRVCGSCFFGNQTIHYKNLSTYCRNIFITKN